MSRPVVVITGRHRPHELLLSGVLAVFLGLAFSIGAPRPQSLAATMPSWLIHVWAALLLLSGVLTLAGALTTRRVRTGLLLEMAGMLIGTGALAITGIAIATFAGAAGLLGEAFCVFWAAANLLRAAQIRADVRSLP